MKGKVIKGVAGKFTVRADGKETVCAARGKLKNDGIIYVGDIAEFDEEKKLITGICARKNSLIRPYVSNVDYVIIVLAPLPEPDFFLSDKLIVDALMAGIEPVVCLNKTDSDDGSLSRRIRANYFKIARIIEVSALNGEITELESLLSDKTVCFAGQSAVGKTSILNALSCGRPGAVGELSQKTARGRHTTRHNEIFMRGDALIIDTAGFSELKLPLMPPNGLAGYYDDFIEFSHGCRYKGCAHVLESESECAVKRAVASGELCRERYDRYLELYKKISETWNEKYK